MFHHFGCGVTVDRVVNAFNTIHVVLGVDPGEVLVVLDCIAVHVDFLDTFVALWVCSDSYEIVELLLCHFEILLTLLS